MFQPPVKLFVELLHVRDDRLHIVAGESTLDRVGDCHARVHKVLQARVKLILLDDPKENMNT